MAHSDIVTLALLTLAVYRIAVLIAQEEGPFGVFAKMREKIDPNQTSWLGRGVRCVACVSFWLAGVAALLLRGSVLDWLSMAGGASIIHRLTMRQA